MPPENEQQQQDGQGQQQEPTGSELRTQFESQLEATNRRHNAALALVRANPTLDTDSPPVRAFLEQYDGEPTLEAVREAAAVWHLLPAEPSGSTEEQTTPPVVPPEQQRQTQERQQLAGTPGEPVAGEANPNPHEAGLAAFHQAVAQGTSREDAAAHYYDRVVDAAGKGDARALLNMDKWREENGLLQPR